MKLSKSIFWISFVITVICLIASIILERNKPDSLINSIIQNILAGTIVLVLTSLAEYHYAKQDALEELIFELKKINRNYLNNLKFWDYRDYPNRERYIENFRKLYTIKGKIPLTEEELNKIYDNNLNKYIRKQKEDFDIIIKQYIEISIYDMDMFWIKYRKISFLTDLRDKKRKKIYNDIFCYWQNIIEEIQEASFHFKEYISSKNGNYSVNKDKLIKLQNIIFGYEENGFTSEFTFNNENGDVCLYGEDNIRGTQFIVVNKASKYIRDYTNYLINLTYSKI